MAEPCEQKDVIDKINQRLVDGELRFAAIEMVQTKTLEVVTEVRDDTKMLSKRLFTDNGTLSVQTRLDRHENVLKIATWLAAVSTSGLIGLLIMEVVSLFKHVHGG